MEKAKLKNIMVEGLIAEDGSKYFSHFTLTKSKEPLNLTEYASKLASDLTTNVIQLSDCETSNNSASAFDYDPDWQSEFKDLVLSER